MSVTNIFTAGFYGTKIIEIKAQIVVNKGMASFKIVGLPGPSIYESKHRIQSAIGSLGIGLPFGSIVVNLTPAGICKEGSYFDLPITIAVLDACNALKIEKKIFAIGEQNATPIAKDAADIINMAINNRKISYRRHGKILSLAQTICDLEKAYQISKDHILEAMVYGDVRFI